MAAATEARTAVIVPTYNELENIERLATQILSLSIAPHLVVVDDNSPDGTGEVVRRLAAARPGRVTLLERAGKLGLGTAYVAGFRTSLESDSAFILTMDADFSHPPATIPQMVAKAGEGYDLVIGSRYVPGGRTTGWPLHRKALSWGANTFARTLLGLQAHDTTAGFRCYRREVLAALPLDAIFSNGYSFLVEVLYKIQRQGWRIGEVPITFANRREGTSKISQAEIYRALYTVLRLFEERVRGA
ncbi:MAG: polyprenol monophosphomannose synthase [Anaerolineales bacterium]